MVSFFSKFTQTLMNAQYPIHFSNEEFDCYINQNFDVRDFNEKMIEIDKIIGEGSYSIVNLAYDLSDKDHLSRLALKFPKDNNIENIKKELKIIEILQKIDKTQFVEISRIYKNKKNYIIAMKYGEGSLDKVLKLRRKKNNPYSQEQIFYILSYLVDGLLLLHENKIIHHDIKCGNFVLFEINGKYKYKYADFGESFKMENINEKIAWKNAGTPFYYPPEIIENQGTIKTYYPLKFDVYCLAIVVLEMMGLTYDKIKAVKTCKNMNDYLSLNMPPKEFENLWPILLRMLESDSQTRISTIDLKNLIVSQNFAFLEKFDDMGEWDLLQKAKIVKKDQISKKKSIYSKISDSIQVLKSFHEKYNLSEVGKKFEKHIKHLLPDPSVKQTISLVLRFYRKIFKKINMEANFSSNLKNMTTNTQIKEKFEKVWNKIYSIANKMIENIQKVDFSFVELKKYYIEFDPFFIRLSDIELFISPKCCICMNMNEGIEILQNNLENFFNSKENMENKIGAFHLSLGIALFHKRNGNLEIALQFLEKACHYCIFGKNSYYYAYVLILSSQIQRQLGEIIKALNLSEEAYNISAGLTIKELKILCLNNKANILKEFREYKKSKDSLNLIFEIFSQHNLFVKYDKEFVYSVKEIIYHNFAEIACYLKEFDNAKKSYELNPCYDEITAKQRLMSLIQDIQLEKLEIIKNLRVYRLDIYVNILLNEDFFVCNDFLLYIKIQKMNIPKCIFRSIEILLDLLKCLKENYDNFPYFLYEMIIILADFKNIDENMLRKKFIDFPNNMIKEVFLLEISEEEKIRKIKNLFEKENYVS